MRVTLLILVALVAACGGGGDGYDTVRDATIAFAEAFCDRSIECGALPDAQRTDCESEVAAAVCAELACSGPFAGNADDVDTCLDALDDHSCTADALPAECLGVIQ